MLHSSRARAVATFMALTAVSIAACSDDSESSTKPADAGNDAAGSAGQDAGTAGGGGAGGAGGSGGSQDAGAEADAPDPGPDVDLGDPQLYSFEFSADEVDPNASKALGTQLAFLDTRVTPRGSLVVYLHGAGAPSVCGGHAHGEMLAGLGFHVVSPCYVSDYGVGGCGDDIEGCRLEAFEGVDHHSFVEIAPEDSIETRVVKALEHLNTTHAGGDWDYFLEGGKPRWDKIVISGISHGASTSAVIGIHRLVARVVSLSGPLDSNQAWLDKTPITPIDRFWGFSHTGDDQHPGHLAAFDALGLPGSPTSVDGAKPPYGGSQRLISSASTTNGHSSTQAGGVSPKDGSGAWVFLPVWTTLYTAP